MQVLIGVAVVVLAVALVSVANRNFLATIEGRTAVARAVHRVFLAVPWLRRWARTDMPPRE